MRTLVGIVTAKTARIQLHYVRLELLFMKKRREIFFYENKKPKAKNGMETSLLISMS